MIQLAVASYDNAAPAAPMAAVFGTERKTIGRGQDNFFVLPDPNHEVARQQAALWSDGARHMLANLSDACPLWVNGVEIAAGEASVIEPGHQVRIGPYLLHVGAAEAQAAHDAPAVDALKAAFLRGAGIDADAITAEWTPELMELLGKLMAGSLQGAIDLLALRSLVKQEVKADVTMVLVRNNNPLKFFPDSQTVLTQMLRKKMPGFMEPLESVEDACHDLRGHQTGVVAGTRASMATMMKRLRPERFEAAARPAGLLDALLPSRRRAAMWDLYVRKYRAIAGESSDPFKTVFGPAFLAAYEREVERFNEGAAQDGKHG